MGSFYATDSITDMSIIGDDPTYIQLIVPRSPSNPYRYSNDICGEKGLRVSNEGALAEFVPFGFPILGKYYDYGYIDNIERDKNVEMLEEFFNLSIEDIIKCATDDRWYKLSYKPCEENTPEEYDEQHDNWMIGNNEMKNVEILKQLTVSYFKKEHYDFLSAEFLTNDSWYSERRNKSIDNMVGILSELSKKRITKVLLTKEDVSDKKIEEFLEIFPKYKELPHDEMLNLYLDIKNCTSWYTPFMNKFYTPQFTTYDMFELLPIDETYEDEVEKQFKFICNMGDLYKVLRPSNYGSQDHNFKAYQRFHEFSANLVNDMDIEHYKDYDDE